MSSLESQYVLTKKNLASLFPLFILFSSTLCFHSLYLLHLLKDAKVIDWVPTLDNLNQLRGLEFSIWVVG
jgi:hypothetical protein